MIMNAEFSVKLLLFINSIVIINLIGQLCNGFFCELIENNYDNENITRPEIYEPYTYNSIN